MTKRRRTFIIVAVIALVVLATAWWVIGMPLPAIGPWRYVGSEYSDRYHEPSCVWARQLEPSRRIYFSSAESAEEKGYRPCAICISP